MCIFVYTFFYRNNLMMTYFPPTYEDFEQITPQIGKVRYHDKISIKMKFNASFNVELECETDKVTTHRVITPYHL